MLRVMTGLLDDYKNMPCKSFIEENLMKKILVKENGFNIYLNDLIIGTLSVKSTKI